MMYAVAKFVHVLGVVLLLGNAIVTALWKTRADRSGDPTAVAFAARTVVAADRAFTLPGAVLVAVAGYAMAFRRPFPLHGLPWLEYGQGLFWLSVILWLLILVPAQRRLVALAEEARRGSPPPGAGRPGVEYAAVSRRWAMWGGIVTLLLVIVLFLMTAKA